MTFVVQIDSVELIGVCVVSTIFTLVLVSQQFNKNALNPRIWPDTFTLDFYILLLPEIYAQLQTRIWRLPGIHEFVQGQLLPSAISA